MTSFHSRYTQPNFTAIMLGAALLCCALILAEALQDHSRFSLGNFVAYAQSSSPTDYNATCKKIAESISPASQVFYPGELRAVALLCASLIDLGFEDSFEFNFDISHWANSSSQVPVCSIEPGTPSDVGLIVNFALLRIHSRCPADAFSTASANRLGSCAVCSERRWARHQPWLFVNPRCTHFDDPVQ
jgi:hypothetical protein